MKYVTKMVGFSCKSYKLSADMTTVVIVNIIVCENEVHHGQSQAVELVMSLYLERTRKHGAGGM